MSERMATLDKAFTRLTAMLPATGESQQENPDDDMRAAVRRLIDRVIAGWNAFDFRIVAQSPHTCPNCDDEATSARTPYCCERCREMAAFVRQFRASIASGAIYDKDRQVRHGQALWHLQGGGYPLRQLLVTPKLLAQVIARAGGRCQVCAAPATEIDHEGSG